MLSQLRTLQPKLQDVASKYNDEEIAFISATFAKITGIKGWNITGCSGLCEDVRNVLLNYLKQNPEPIRIMRVESPKEMTYGEAFDLAKSKGYKGARISRAKLDKWLAENNK
jgi:hypothetical protein